MHSMIMLSTLQFRTDCLVAALFTCRRHGLTVNDGGSTSGGVSGGRSGSVSGGRSGGEYSTPEGEIHRG